MHPRRRDRIAANPFLQIIPRNRERHRQHRALAHLIREAILQPAGRGDRSHVQNHPTALRHHRPNHRLRAVIHTLYIHREDPIHVRAGHRLHRPDPGNAGIVHQNIQLPQRKNLAEYPLDLILIGHIAAMREGPAPIRLNPLDRRQSRVSVKVHDMNRRSRPRETLSNRQTDPARRSRDNRRTAIQPEFRL